ncbi:flagellar transcriptional regulator FlhD [Burkholderia pseudomallei]|nr:flagellar transcriptional regulator FlhD [Burkholderia pseudomallei]
MARIASTAVLAPEDGVFPALIGGAFGRPGVRRRFPPFVGKIPTRFTDNSGKAHSPSLIAAPPSIGQNARKNINKPIAPFAVGRSSKRFHWHYRLAKDFLRGNRIMSATSEMLAEINEVNLSYLLLAQRLLREDKAMGMFRMGISEELADVLVNLTLAQTVKLAASNQMLCRFRFDDHALLSSLADKGRSSAVSHAHSAILMAGQPVESLR